MSELVRLLTDRQVAELLAVSPDTVRRWAARGELPCIRLGRLLRFRPSDVDAWLRRRTSEDIAARVHLRRAAVRSGRRP